MQNIGIFYNPTLFKNIQKLQSHIEFLVKNSFNVSLLGSQKRDRLENISYVQAFTKDNIDSLIVLGGDGTILLASKLVLKKGIPILGFNHGKLGFLSECDKHEFEFVISALKNDSYSIEERMVLEYLPALDRAEIRYALNDCVLYKGIYPKMLTFEVFGNQEFLFNIEADGLVVSTPTGSTGYNISAGGSIAFPSTNVLLLTPINPHNQFIKPFILSADMSLTINYIKGDSQVCIAIDGENVDAVDKNIEILIKKSVYQSRFIKLPDKSFAKIVREKFIG
ncbi:MAG: NAD(+)/NADH kinase [Candidatus Cloacimonetes bacterium]|nr:NAD(+)/NADH kinase [Candidatus Cloacimonadota bacterium]